MSPADRIAKVLNAEIKPWLQVADSTIKETLSDVRAHAEKAVTESAINTTDGRPTIGKIRASRSFRAAVNKLGKLRVMLSGIVREARLEFYEKAFARNVVGVPAELLVSAEPKPTQANLNRFAAIVLHGQTAETVLDGITKDVGRRLLATLTLAARQGGTKDLTAERLEVWRANAEISIGRIARTLLSDSQIAAGSETARHVIHPDYLDETPLEIGN